MVTTENYVAPDVEPTEEFNSRCATLIQEWQHGDLTVIETVDKLKLLTKDAVDSGHIANQGRAEHISGYLHHYLGNLSTSIMHYQRARTLFERVGNRRRVATMDLNQGENYRYRGEFKRARRLYRNCYQAATELGEVQLQAIAIVNEGLVLVSLKEYDQARKALNEGSELAKDESFGDYEALYTEIYYGLAVAAMNSGDMQDAWHQATLAAQMALTSDNKLSMGLAYRILGDAFTEFDNAPDDAEFDTADEYYRKAMSLLEDVGAEAEMGRTTYSHARSLAKRGRRTAAAKLFRDAMVVFTRLSMTDDAAKAAEAQLGVL